MGWNKTLPQITTKVRSSPVIFIDNWNAIEDFLEQEHYTFSSPLSGYHKPGHTSAVYIGPQSALTALWAAPPTGSMAAVTDPNGCKLLMVCTSSAGSGTWENYTPIEHYVHTQTSSATSWTVTHNLGRKIIGVQVYDASFKQVIPDSVTLNSTTQCTITFAIAAAGSATVG